MELEDDSDTAYSIYSTWIDGVSRITRIRYSDLKKTPKWTSPDEPLPIDLHQAFRLATEAMKQQRGVHEGEYSWGRIVLDAIEPDMCFWCMTFLHFDDSYYHSMEIAVLMDGKVVLPEVE